MPKKKGTRKKKASKVKTLPPPPEPTVKADWSKHHGHASPQFGCYDCAQLNRGMWVCICLCPNIARDSKCKACGAERTQPQHKCTCGCQRKSHKDMTGACKNCQCKKFEPSSKAGGAR